MQILNRTPMISLSAILFIPTSFLCLPLNYKGKVLVCQWESGCKIVITIRNHESFLEWADCVVQEGIHFFLERENTPFSPPHFKPHSVICSDQPS
jgi:hypothetical protein